MEFKKYIYMYIDRYLYIADTEVVCIQDINLGVKRLSVARMCCFSSLGWWKERGTALEGEQQSRARLQAMPCRGPFGAGSGPGSSLSPSQAGGEGGQVPQGWVLLLSLSLRVFGPVTQIRTSVLRCPGCCRGAGSITGADVCLAIGCSAPGYQQQPVLAKLIKNKEKDGRGAGQGDALGPGGCSSQSDHPCKG